MITAATTDDTTDDGSYTEQVAECWKDVSFSVGAEGHRGEWLIYLVHLLQPSNPGRKKGSGCITTPD